MLNKQSPIPLYHQLAEILMTKINKGEYTPGDKITAETSLARMYQIGRPTVRQAIDILVRKGLVERRRGSGTFVTNGKKEIDLFSLVGTTSAFQKKHIKIQVETLADISLKTNVKGIENPFYKKRAFHFSRLTRARNKPVLIENIYLHADLFMGIEQLDLATIPLSSLIKDKFYMEPSACRQTFRIEKLYSSRADTLNVPVGEPVLLVNRYLHFPQAENAIFSKIYARTDSFVFSQEIMNI